jgi:hypothetical protein
MRRQRSARPNPRRGLKAPFRGAKWSSSRSSGRSNRPWACADSPYGDSPRSPPSGASCVCVTTCSSCFEPLVSSSRARRGVFIQRDCVLRHPPRSRGGLGGSFHGRPRILVCRPIETRCKRQVSQVTAGELEYEVAPQSSAKASRLARRRRRAGSDPARRSLPRRLRSISGCERRDGWRRQAGFERASRCRNRVFALEAHRLKSVGGLQSRGRSRKDPQSSQRSHPLWTAETRHIPWLPSSCKRLRVAVG